MHSSTTCKAAHRVAYYSAHNNSQWFRIQPVPLLYVYFYMTRMASRRLESGGTETLGVGLNGVALDRCVAHAQPFLKESCNSTNSFATWKADSYNRVGTLRKAYEYPGLGLESAPRHSDCRGVL